MKKSELKALIREAIEGMEKPSETFYLFKLIGGHLVSVSRKEHEPHVVEKFESAIGYLLSPEEAKSLSVKHNPAKSIYRIHYFDTGFEETLEREYYIVREDALEEFETKYSAGRKIVAHPKYLEKMQSDKDTSHTKFLPAQNA